MKRFYVYVYCNPLKPSSLHPSGFEPFYVGKGQGQRMNYHFTDWSLKFDENRHKVRTIQKIINSGNIPIVVKEFETLDEEEAYEKEKMLINQFGRKDKRTGVLTNMTDGGEGKRGYITSEKTKKFISEKRKIYLGTLTQEEKKQILGTMRNKKHSDESLKKMSIAVKSALSNPETKIKRSIANSMGNNPRARPVEVFNTKYSCVTEAVKKTGLHKVKLKKQQSFRYIIE